MYIGGKPPRGKYCAGIIQDEHGGVVLEEANVLPSGEITYYPDPPRGDVAAERFEKMDHVYDLLGMKRNLDKDLRRAFNGILWGGSFDGVAGTTRPLVPRCVALSILTFILVHIRHCTPELLEILGGSFCAAYMFRRPLMCQLFFTYAARKGHGAHDILSMSMQLMRELIINILLLPLAVTNHRAQGASRVYACDASSRMYACVGLFK